MIIHMTNTTAHPMSRYQLRNLIENLRRFDDESAYRQVALHLNNGTITEADAQWVTAAISNHRIPLN